MPATFLQPCDHALDNATKNSSLSEPMVEHIRQNKHKHMWQLQVQWESWMESVVCTRVDVMIVCFVILNRRTAWEVWEREELGEKGISCDLFLGEVCFRGGWSCFGGFCFSFSEERCGAARCGEEGDFARVFLGFFFCFPHCFSGFCVVGLGRVNNFFACVSPPSSF